MRNLLISRLSIGTAVLGLAGTVTIISAQGTPPPAGGRGGQQTAPPAGGGRARGGVMGAGPGDAPYVDSALADKGKSVWAAECINCHGTQARGTDNGPNLTPLARGAARSLRQRARTVSEASGHQMQSGASAATLTDEQIVDLAHFLRQRVNDTLRGSPHLHGAERADRRCRRRARRISTARASARTCHTRPPLSLAGIGGNTRADRHSAALALPGRRTRRARGGAAPRPRRAREGDGDAGDGVSP